MTYRHDPLAPFTSRFPQSPTAGRIVPDLGPASAPSERPYGMRFAVQSIDNGKHSMRPTQKSRSKQTAITDDNQVKGYETDTEYYVEMDEE